MAKRTEVRTGNKQTVECLITDTGRIVTQQVMKEYEVGKPTSKQIDGTVKWKPNIIEPPYNLAKLMNWMSVNVVHSSCIHTKKQDTVGIGYDFIHDDELVMQERERDVNYKRLVGFFGMVNESEDIVKVLKKVFVDYEGCGNGYIEVTRDVEDKINGLYHINALTVRHMKDKERFVQQVAGQYVYFKQFGDERILNNRTGNFVKEVKDPEEIGSEIINFTQYSWLSSLYGVPEWLPALYAMFGNMKEVEYNIDFFVNFGVPAYAILVQGALLTPAVNEEITKFFETELKGSNHKTLTLSTPKGAEIKFQKLNVDSKESSFRMYRKDNRDDVLTAHKVPPYRVAIVEQGALGGNVAEETDRIYLDSVINPKQEEIAWTINEILIRRGLEIEGWKFVFKDIDIEDSKKNSEIADRYFKMGALNSNEIRQKYLKLDPYLGGDVYYVAGNMVAVGTSSEEDDHEEEAGETADEAVDDNEGKKPGKPDEKEGDEAGKQGAEEGSK